MWYVGYKGVMGCAHLSASPSLHQPVTSSPKCNVKLNYEKLQYKQDEVEFFGETYTTSGT